MTEKTAEEKLREELEGKLSEKPHEQKPEVSESGKKPVKPRAMRSRSSSRKTEKPMNVGQRVDSFMEDFEKRIAESLKMESFAEAGGVKAAENSDPAKKAAVKTVRYRRKKLEDTAFTQKSEDAGHDVLGLGAIAEISEAKQDIAVPAEPEPHIPEPEAMPEPELPTLEPEAIPEPELPTPEPEAIPEPELLTHEPETMPEPELPIPEPETMPEPELPTPEPETSQEFPVEIVDETEQVFDDKFPDIPVIDAQEIADASDSSEDNTLPDIPVLSPEPEELDDTFADIAALDDGLEEPSEETEETDNPSPDSPDTENNTEFPPFADVVVNVDDELPQINSDSLENTSDNFAAEVPDPESEAAPVTVAMPESTKTAEDKLMANIAEAMTGSPLTLDKPDPSEPYRLPENLLNPQNDPNTSPQSAEEKLIADISQAISESPIETAQNQANQNFEADISPFDEMPLPEPIQTPDFDDSYEQVQDEHEEAEEEEGDDFDEPFLPDFSAQTEQQEQQQAPRQEDSLLGEDFSELPVAEDDTAVDEDMPDFSLLDMPENDSEPEPEIELEPEPEQELEPELQPVTAEDRLAQELANFTNPESSNDQQPEPEPQPEYQEPLTSPQTSEDDSGEDFNFMDSWGDAASAVNYGDDDPEPHAQEPVSLEQIPEPHPEPVTRITTHAPQNLTVPDTPEAPKTSPIWSILLQAVLGLLILAGVFSLFRLHQLTDNITAMMLYGNTSGFSAQSYDYAVDMIPDEEISSRMRLRGIEGWKLVGSRRTQDSVTGRYGYEFIFMRQKPTNY